MRLDDRQYMMGHGKASMTDHYTTTPEIERKRPFVERITRALLGLDPTSWGPSATSRSKTSA